MGAACETNECSGRITAIPNPVSYIFGFDPVIQLKRVK